MTDRYDSSPQEHLYRNRIIYLSGDISTATADYVITRLLVLDSIDPTAEIRLYLSSYGGGVYPGLAIYDAMNMIDAPVSTFCVGPAFSMAAWLLAAGAPGRRFATLNSRIMLHQISTGLSGTSADIKVAAQNLVENEKLMNAILARHTQLDVEAVARVIERDRWLTAQEAIELGVIDSIAPPSGAKQRLLAEAERAIPSLPAGLAVPSNGKAR